MTGWFEIAKTDKEQYSLSLIHIWYRQVGWNWMNSMFATRQPARQAIATPSPVAVSGFVV